MWRTVLEEALDLSLDRILWMNEVRWLPKVRSMPLTDFCVLWGIFYRYSSVFLHRALWYNYSNINQRNAQFSNVFLIRFSTCFEHLVFITRKTIYTCSFIWYVFYAFV
jgi:hypothetical protein